MFDSFSIAANARGALTLGRLYCAQACLSHKLQFVFLVWVLCTVLRHGTHIWPWHGWKRCVSFACFANAKVRICYMDIMYNQCKAPNVFLFSCYLCRNLVRNKIYWLELLCIINKSRNVEEWLVNFSKVAVSKGTKTIDGWAKILRRDAYIVLSIVLVT